MTTEPFSQGVESDKKLTGRSLAIVCCCIVVALAGYIGTAGLSWSKSFHPDEKAIAKWIDQVRDCGYITDRAYPSGWFELFRIRFWLENMQDLLTRCLQNHRDQVGRVNALEAKSFNWTPVIQEKKEPHYYSIQDGRDFNAWLYVFSALFLFAACIEVGQRPLVAMVSSLFFLASAAPIEFLHYCETDEGLVISLAFFTWITARAIRKRSALLVIAAGAVAGFATSCKFTLFPLVLWFLIAPFAIRWKAEASPRRRITFSLFLALAFLFAAAFGYFIGTPALRFAPRWYWMVLKTASAKTYAEINLVFGGAPSPWAAYVHRLAGLGKELSDIGFLPIAWALFSWCFWFSRPFRRQALGVPVSLPLFFPFLVFFCPFVRRQETLPLSILFAFGAGLPLEWLLRGEMKWKAAAPRCIIIAGASLLGVSALATGAFRACGMISCFKLRDTRVEAQNWLRDSLPSEEPIAFDAYVGQSARGVDCTSVQYACLPFSWNGRKDAFAENVCPMYYVENVGFPGRIPIRDRRTGFIKPQVRKSLEDFRQSTLPLRTWSVAKHTVTPTFGQPCVRLLALERPATNSVDIPIGYCRPLRLLPKGVHLYDTGGVNGLGAVQALQTFEKQVPIQSPIHVNLDNGPRWLVTRMLVGDAPARIRRNSLFVPGNTILSPGGTVAAALDPSPWERFLSHGGAYATMKCQLECRSQKVFCGTFLAKTAAEAARELRAGGDPAGALAILREAGPLDTEASVEAFLAATEANVEPQAEWMEAARKALAACDSLAATDRASSCESATLCGIPAEILSDFARMRLGVQRLSPGMRLPAYLPPGNYELSLVLHPLFSQQNVMPHLFDAQTTDFQLERSTSGREVLRASLTIEKGQILRVTGRYDVSFSKMTGNPNHIPIKADVEITWSPIEHTLSVAESIRIALDKNSVY